MIGSTRTVVNGGRSGNPQSGGPKWIRRKYWKRFHQERQFNDVSINKQNAESLKREKESIDNPIPFTARQKAILYTDYENKGSVAAIAVARKRKAWRSCLQRCRTKEDKRRLCNQRPIILSRRPRRRWPVQKHIAGKATEHEQPG